MREPRRQSKRNRQRQFSPDGQVLEKAMAVTKPDDRVDQATRPVLSSPHERMETYQSGVPYPIIVGGWTGAGLLYAELPSQELIQLRNGLT